MNAHGIKNAAALLSGWNGWTAAKLPIAVSKKK
jgi:3-mercaptopyruvate sulfurtransferase SseA